MASSAEYAYAKNLIERLVADGASYQEAVQFTVDALKKSKLGDAYLKQRFSSNGREGEGSVYGYTSNLFGGESGSGQYVPAVSRVRVGDKDVDLLLFGNDLAAALDAQKIDPKSIDKFDLVKAQLERDMKYNQEVLRKADPRLQNSLAFATEVGLGYGDQVGYKRGFGEGETAGITTGQNQLYDKLSNPMNVLTDERTRMAGVALAALGLLPGVAAGAGTVALLDDGSADDYAIQQALMAA
ncbi:hypothetical protein VZG28_05050 [Synechococcus elongatus IITB4]|uniref:hypothetical protein n=1 Tax=Synechococcus elongatus TaxID=32046 RepID=UPI0030D469FC